jgi:hypothetical protein
MAFPFVLPVLFLYMSLFKIYVILLVQVAAVGTTLFVVLLGSLLYEKHKYEKEQAKLREPALERVLKEEK